MADTDIALAWEMYSAGGGRDPELIDLAESVWNATRGASRSADSAETLRLARLACLRTSQRERAEVMAARSTVAAFLNGDQNSMAALLIPRVFALIEVAAYEAASEVLSCIAELIDETDNSPLSLNMLRLYHEKTAFVLYKQGKYEAATDSYRRALKNAGEDRRGRLKVRGGLALVQYEMSDVDSHEAIDAAAEMRQIAAEAEQGGHADVRDAAHWNAEKMEQGIRTGLRPFEF